MTTEEPMTPVPLTADERALMRAGPRLFRSGINVFEPEGAQFARTTFMYQTALLCETMRDLWETIITPLARRR